MASAKTKKKVKSSKEIKERLDLSSQARALNRIPKVRTSFVCKEVIGQSFVNERVFDRSEMEPADDEDPFDILDESDVDEDGCVNLFSLSKEQGLIDKIQDIDWELAKKQWGEASSSIIHTQIDVLTTLLLNMKVLYKTNKKKKKIVPVHIKEVQKYLGTDSYFNTNCSFNGYSTHLALYSITKMVKDKELFKCERSYFFDENQQLAPIPYFDIPIDYNKNKSVVAGGWYWMEYKGIKFVLCVQVGNNVNVVIFVEADNEEKTGEIFEVFQQYVKKNNFYLGKKLEVDGNGSFTITPPTGKTWNDIVINDVIKNEIDDNVIQLVNKRELYEANGIPTSRGIILAGSYGLGKTLLCKVLCDLVDCTVFYMSSKAMSSPDAISNIYDTAAEFAKQGMPSLMILEDMDLYGQDRESGNIREGILGELMNQLNGLDDKFGIVTIGTTNRLDTIEKALKDRPGRFDRVLHFDLPTEEQRLEILEQIVSKYTTKGLTLSRWAQETKDFSGAHLSDLVKTAVIEAIKNGDFISTRSKKVKLSDKHFESALDRIHKVSIKRVGFRGGEK